MAQISDVRIYRLKIIGPQKPFAAVTLDGEFAIPQGSWHERHLSGESVHGIKVMENEKGLWVSMPTRKDAKGEFQDVFHPVTKEARGEDYKGCARGLPERR